MKKIAVLALTLLGSASFAQMPPDAARRPDVARMTARQADDIALLLGLAPAQRPALDAWLKLDRPPFGPGRPFGPGTPGEAPPEARSFVERLDEMEKRLDAGAADQRKRITAARAFYGLLDARQKPLFEALDRLRHRPPNGGPMAAGPDHGPDGPRGPKPPAME